MSDPATFKCARLKSSITISKCLRNQREAIEFFGNDAAKFNTCPCNQGKEIKKTKDNKKEAIDMPKGKAVCRNCNRLMIIQQDGLCGGCNCAARRAGEKGSPEFEKALAEAKERLAGKDPRQPVKTAIIKPEKKAPKKAPKKSVRILDNTGKQVSSGTVVSFTGIYDPADSIKSISDGQVIPITIRLMVEVCLKQVANS